MMSQRDLNVNCLVFGESETQALLPVQALLDALSGASWGCLEASWGLFWVSRGASWGLLAASVQPACGLRVIIGAGGSKRQFEFPLPGPNFERPPGPPVDRGSRPVGRLGTPRLQS